MGVFIVYFVLGKKNYLNAWPCLKPSFLSSLTIGQKPVKPAKSRFAPTNAVKYTHAGEW